MITKNRRDAGKEGNYEVAQVKRTEAEETALTIRRMVGGIVPRTEQGREEYYNKIIELSKKHPELSDWIKPVEAIVSYFKQCNYEVIRKVNEGGNENEKRIMSQLEGDGHGF